MKSTLLRAAALAALTLAGAPDAEAEAASVTCQSRNNQREECWLRGRGEVVLVRQISNTKCVKGRNWGETRNGIYVDDGCGGVFETRDGGNDGRPGQGGGWNGGPGGPGGGNNDGWRDLVGVRASSGEQELQRRGYRYARGEAAPGGRFVYWRTPQRGCIEVRVADGRFQTIRAVNPGDCDGGRPVPGPGGRPDQRPGDGPNPAMCNAQYSSQGGGDASVERRTQIRPGVWEFVLQFPDRRFVCRTDDRGRVLSFNPA